MRRPLTIAAFVVLVALASASAQRGGIRPSGGRGFGVGQPSGGHAFMGMRGAPSARFSFRGNSFGGVRIRTHRFRHCFGCFQSFGFPWWGSSYPFGWWDSSSSYNYDQDQARERALADEMNRLNLEEQRLREQEDWARERERQRDPDPSAGRSQSREQDRPIATPATVLVFRDQHQLEIRNYAIADGTLWVVSEQSAKKIPLSELDLDATTKANDERGVEFQVPR
jgi:hypothetical protein